MKQFQNTFVALLTTLPSSHAFWRLGCGISQRGRIDPIINPGKVAAHAHVISGAINIDAFSTPESLQSANCTTCTIQADKSAYWTPQLYYQFPNGSFSTVPNGGTIIYYLGRGDNAANIVPFPSGYQVVSGDPSARSYNKDNLTYLDTRPIADRTSFACINYDHPSKETPGMTNTNCPQGLRAQIQFPSCWDGVHAYLPNSAHVTYMSQIDNGKCPPTHPKSIPHLFFELYYSVDKFNGQGGNFIWSNGDTTGYSFHGDFMNGWDAATLNAAVKDCLVGNPSGVTEQCQVFKASNDAAASAHCPIAAPLVDEQIEGILSSLPGCNPVTSGPEKAVAAKNCSSPSMTSAPGGGSNIKISSNLGSGSISNTVSGSSASTDSNVACNSGGNNGNMVSNSGESGHADAAPGPAPMVDVPAPPAPHVDSDAASSPAAMVDSPTPPVMHVDSDAASSSVMDSPVSVDSSIASTANAATTADSAVTSIMAPTAAPFANISIPTNTSSSTPLTSSSGSTSSTSTPQVSTTSGSPSNITTSTSTTQMPTINVTDGGFSIGSSTSSPSAAAPSLAARKVSYTKRAEAENVGKHRGNHHGQHGKSRYRSPGH